MIIDSHAHIPHNTDVSEIIFAMDKYGVNLMLLSNPLIPGGFYPSSAQIEEMNNLTKKYVSRYPERLKYLCYVNPMLDAAEDYVKKSIENDGAIGIKLWVATKCNVSCIDKIAELAKEYSVPLLIHTLYKYIGQLPDESIAEEVADIAKRHPDTKIIMAHLGGNAHLALKHVKKIDNVWTDISGIGFRNGDIEYAVKHMGEDKVLFGTDLPGCSFHASIGKVNEADISDTAKEKIFRKNAEFVYKLN